VRLWDLRFPAPTARFPDPRPTHSHARFLPDPTLGLPSSRRPRGIHSLVESPTSGDIYALTGDSNVHTLRPAYASLTPNFDDPAFQQAILPDFYASKDLHVQTFFVRMALSPDGRYLATGNSKAGVVTFDTREKRSKGVVFDLGKDPEYWPKGRAREVTSVDWGRDCMAACADDRVTRIWRSDGDRKEQDEWGSIGGEEVA
jgi:denticleless